MRGRNECPLGVAPGRMPRADATEWLRRNRLTLPRSHRGAGGFLFLDRDKQKNLHFFGEAPERRPWAIKRERSPGCLCRALRMAFPAGIPVSAYTCKYPIPAAARNRTRLHPAPNCTKPPRRSRPMPKKLRFLMTANTPDPALGTVHLQSQLLLDPPLNRPHPPLGRRLTAYVNVAVIRIPAEGVPALLQFLIERIQIDVGQQG